MAKRHNTAAMIDPQGNCADSSAFGNWQVEDLWPVVVGVRSAPLSGVERVDALELLNAQVEIEDGEVLGDTTWVRRLRNRRAAVLQMPAQHHLGRRFAAFLG